MVARGDGLALCYLLGSPPTREKSGLSMIRVTLVYILEVATASVSFFPAVVFKCFLCFWTNFLFSVFLSAADATGASLV